MGSAELLATLTDLKENRRMPAEIAEAIDPLRGQKFALELEFVSSSRTFGNRFDSSYDNGYTATCKAGETSLEISVIFGAKENSFVEDHKTGDTFSAEVTLLEFDALYQRAIFGHCMEKATTLQKEPNDEKFAEESQLEEDKIKGPEEIPEEKEETRTEVADPEVVAPDSQATASRNNWNVVLAAGGLLAVFFATTQWEPLEGVSGWAVEWDTLNGVAGWVLWAFLIYPLGLGLPCLANRAWISLSLALAAFVFDLTGTFLDNENGAFSTNEAVVGEPVEGGDSTEIEEDEAQENSGVMFYNVAMSLQAFSVLGLSISLAKKTGARWCLVMALLFAGYTYLVLQPDYSGFDESIVSSVNPSFPFLVAMGFCCWSIIRHEMKLLAQEYSKSEEVQSP